MTRKDYNSLAEAFGQMRRKIHSIDQIRVFNDMIGEFCAVAERDNERFHKETFHAAVNEAAGFTTK